MLFRFLLLLLICAPSALSAAPYQAMVVAAQKSAAEAGMAMLEKSGNAFDAAAATALALGVVEPGSSGIGGGGFFLLYIAREDRYVMIDARETSPKLAGNGEVFEQQSSIDGPQSAGVPGLAAGVDHLIETYGRLNRNVITQPAIDLASNGFAVGPRLRSMLEWRSSAFSDMARTTFLAGDTIRQPALADTLRRFARGGRDDFYRGETAGRLVADMKRDGGLIRESDLATYRVIEREPIIFDYRGFQFVSAALPSSGGMTLANVFGQLQDDNLKVLNQSDRIHLLVEAMKRAYRDRNAHMGDSDFVEIPDLLNPKRLQQQRAGIRMEHATPSSEIGNSSDAIGPGTDTTHFSVIDAEGNMVSATLSINYAFGSGYLSPSTGILLNDEMDDFATRPGKPNAFGLVQGSANAVAPGKRMLSSMTPTFVIGPDRTFIVGTPGGSRIISMVLLASLGFMLDETAAAEWVNAPRYHHQFLPDEIQHEQGAFNPDVANELQKRGHKLKLMKRRYGNMHAILIERETGKLTGIPDARGEGVAIRQE
ncbi:gamma-glutamyltranspeptidase [Mariprofundus ferrinatatus]|uniref:Glutathione hydrolase proenzyme n=1 Tax=Mariprofundus ferrinatatus TaxID=1921087 RepID=A0A2K8L127_9PROT|nr:gamma-glutamyltransferase [Mariprofundus ferrinatatus]ATX80987.1 gamma-glutamyltranspeptidase [Mariprofundus ferrinatatus]